MTSGRPVSLRIAGQSFNVVSSATESELHRLAAVVSGKVVELTPPGRAIAPQGIVLAALALAHDLEVERARRIEVERRAGELLRRALGGIEDALDCTSEQ